MKCKPSNAEMDRVILLFPEFKGYPIGHVIPSIPSSSGKLPSPTTLRLGIQSQSSEQSGKEPLVTLLKRGVGVWGWGVKRFRLPYQNNYINGRCNITQE